MSRPQEVGEASTVKEVLKALAGVPVDFHLEIKFVMRNVNVRVARERCVVFLWSWKQISVERLLNQSALNRTTLAKTIRAEYLPVVE